MSDFDTTLSQQEVPVISTEDPHLDELDTGTSPQPDEGLVTEVEVTVCSDSMSPLDFATELESKIGGLLDLEFVSPSEVE